MDKFIIQGGAPLRGHVTPSGNKNAALPIIAAALLTDEPLTLRNVPRIRDVQDMLGILAEVGVEVHHQDPHTVTLRAANLRDSRLNQQLCAQIRASILFAGPMLARRGEVFLPPPGGDVIGRRRVDTHFFALRELGAEVEVKDGYQIRTGGLKGADIFLDETSVTATENALMAAALATGVTVIRNAASEPHVSELAQVLNRMGAHIDGIGSNTLTIHGVDRLHGAEFEIGPDHIEVGSFIALAAATHGEVTIHNTRKADLRMITIGFERLGVECQIRDNQVFIPAQQSLQIQSDINNAVAKIDDGPWPAFPTDLMSMMLVTATQCQGTILIHEKMFEGRMFFVDRLVSMGARIVLCDPHRAVVVGPARLRAEPGGLPSPDIRAGMALLEAALCADGCTIIQNIGQIDRGYEHIEDKLRALGAQIERVSS
ncbi:MAG: UDP-N-acetylglucosamine 1-carboxyvinyltransferase [Anaerolineae bacterium]